MEEDGLPSLGIPPFNKFSGQYILQIIHDINLKIVQNLYV